jgi:hypothetical protein
MQGLVFELQKDLDNVRFRLEIFHGKGTQFLQLLLALHESCYPSYVEPHASGNERSILVSAAQRNPKEEATPDMASMVKATSWDA